MPDSPPASEPARSLDGPSALSATRYLAWLYTPLPQQPAFAALCEIEGEIVSSTRPGIDHHVAHARLQWWREECDRAAQGRAVHPLTRKLTNAGNATDAVAAPALEGISGFVDTAIWDLAAATFETRQELTAYCERWGTAMFQTATALNATGASDLSAPQRWRTLGAAVREIELLSNLAEDAHVGRLRVPLDELERAGVDLKAMSKPPWPSALVDLLSGRHESLRATLSNAVAEMTRQEQADSRGLMVWTALAWRQSLRAQRALPNVIPPSRYHALADGWQAWRAARRAVAGRLSLS